MRLRALESKDAPYMLEWMHDESVVQFMGRDFSKNTLEGCEQFIYDSQTCSENYHRAIVDDFDEYMGTVSLKHINHELSMAEFAITVRKCAMGKGYSSYGMNEIIRLGKSELGLKKIVWCVSKKNERAVRFYDKKKYKRTLDIPKFYKDMYTEEQLLDFIWYEEE